MKILQHSGEIIKVYGEDYKTSPIILQFTDIGEYVGHYDCSLEDQEEEEEPVHRPEISSLLQALSPLPRIKNLRKCTCKSEATPISTSSPYKTYLSDKANKVNKVNKTQTRKNERRAAVSRHKNHKAKETAKARAAEAR